MWAYLPVHSRDQSTFRHLLSSHRPDPLGVPRLQGGGGAIAPRAPAGSSRRSPVSGLPGHPVSGPPGQPVSQSVGHLVSQSIG
eukprot:4663163-Pyramimonas_sp.AAC.1